MDRPPVAVVVLDTLRSDMLSDPELLRSLPGMAKVFQNSYLFTHAYAPAQWTLPSHASLFTGLAPSEHLAHPPQMHLRDDARTLAQVFRSNGYYTACLTCNPWISDKYGMTRGFDSVWMPPVSRWDRGVDRFSRLVRVQRRTPQVLLRFLESIATIVRTNPRHDNGARATISRLQGLMEEVATPLFLFVNLMEAHAPYFGRGAFSGLRRRVQQAQILRHWAELVFRTMGGGVQLTDDTRRSLQGIYWESVRYLDSALEEIVSILNDGFLEEGYLILLSDHGQMLGEGGFLDHIAGMGEELLSVPMSIRPPGGIDRQIVTQPVNITWLYSLLTEIAEGDGQALPSWLSRLSQRGAVISEAHGELVPYIRRPRLRVSVSAEDVISFSRTFDRPALSCAEGSRRLVCHLGRMEDELYDLHKRVKLEVTATKQEEGILDAMHQKLSTGFLHANRRPHGPAYTDRLPGKAKVAIADVILSSALEVSGRSVLVWTGGKDSTLVLSLALEVSKKTGLEIPSLLLIDHGQHYEETWSFLRDVTEQKGLEVAHAANDQLLETISRGKRTIPFEQLSRENQEEALKAGLTETEVPLTLNTAVGNHLLKTVALNRYIERNSIELVVSGIRWDENLARSTEVFFSPRENPPHVRVHPILPWSERDVWDYTLENELPVHPLYKQGFRSFDGVLDSSPTDKRPAWEQDFEVSDERGGRAQDKEEIMERLRLLGYF